MSAVQTAPTQETSEPDSDGPTILADHPPYMCVTRRATRRETWFEASFAADAPTALRLEAQSHIPMGAVLHDAYTRDLFGPKTLILVYTQPHTVVPVQHCRQ